MLLKFRSSRHFLSMLTAEIPHEGPVCCCHPIRFTNPKYFCGPTCISMSSQKYLQPKVKIFAIKKIFHFFYRAVFFQPPLKKIFGVIVKMSLLLLPKSQPDLAEVVLKVTCTGSQEQVFWLFTIQKYISYIYQKRVSFRVKKISLTLTSTYRKFSTPVAIPLARDFMSSGALNGYSMRSRLRSHVWPELLSTLFRFANSPWDEVIVVQNFVRMYKGILHSREKRNEQPKILWSNSACWW